MNVNAKRGIMMMERTLNARNVKQAVLNAMVQLFQIALPAINKYKPDIKLIQNVNARTIIILILIQKVVNGSITYFKSSKNIRQLLFILE